ncbi:MAG: hypothetical protein JJT87_00865 [Halomonas sp.]|nr:hypothetical protein [Halomonas sp.]MCC5900466.1 hypothetical protein [Halomonas sp.]
MAGSSGAEALSQNTTNAVVGFARGAEGLGFENGTEDFKNLIGSRAPFILTQV